MTTIQKNKNGVPELRFPAHLYDEGWERNPIIDYLSKVIDYRGKAPPKKEIGIPLITARNVRFGYLDFKEDEYIDSNLFESWMNRGIPQPDDVMFTTEAPLGNVALFPKKGTYAIGQRIITLQTDKMKCDSKFLFQHLISPKTQKQIQRRGTGSTAKGIKSKLFIKIPIAIPPLPEQQKIASFLSSVDKKIDHITRKKHLWERYKKGMMQQIFSQEIRFKDEDGQGNPVDFPDWEEKMLGDVLLSYNLGGNYSNSEKKTNFPLIKMGNIGRGKIKLNKVEYITENEEINSNDRIKYGDLFFNTRNTLDLVGKVAIWINELDEAYYNSNLMRMKFNNNFFMNYFFNSFSGIKSLKRIATGTTSVAAIYTKDLLKIKIFIAIDPEEQKKIADFLSSIDKKISIISSELEKAKSFKKALLQQMFV